MTSLLDVFFAKLSIHVFTFLTRLFFLGVDFVQFFIDFWILTVYLILSDGISFRK